MWLSFSFCVLSHVKMTGQEEENRGTKRRREWGKGKEERRKIGNGEGERIEV